MRPVGLAKKRKKWQKLSCVKLAICPDHPRWHRPLKFCMRGRIREVVIYFKAHGLYNSLYYRTSRDIAPRATYCYCSDAVCHRESRRSASAPIQAPAHWLWSASIQPFAALICCLIVSTLVIDLCFRHAVLLIYRPRRHGRLSERSGQFTQYHLAPWLRSWLLLLLLL